MKKDLQEKRYPINQEKQLLSKVRLGDKKGAVGILNELLGKIFFNSNGNQDILKARILELVVILSRAAVEGGASMEKMLGMNYVCIQELSSLKSYEELCKWTVKVMETFIDNVYQTRFKIIEEIMSFIRKNYNQPISLQTVGKHFKLNTYTLCRLFKNEVGINFHKYLTKVRIEEAKDMLRNNKKDLLDISLETGFVDVSHFAKTFKKTEGMTPSQYKKFHLNVS